MRNLQVKTQLKKKLDRLKDPVANLSFSGIDPNYLMKSPIVAVVGTRKPTPYGKQITEKLVSELVKAGVIIVSGLAFGIDILAHRTALEEKGTTISVLPSGLDNIYPATHRGVAKKIKEIGCLISEYPEDHKPRKVEFLERNRIIAALSDLVVIPEAAERSGSLNTASHAKSMNIPVCAFPGHVLSSMSRGTNELIKKSEATLVTRANDILEILEIDTKPKTTINGNELETSILEKISSGMTDSTQLQLELDTETREFQSIMTIMEIDGKVHQDEMGNWQIS